MGGGVSNEPPLHGQKSLQFALSTVLKPIHQRPEWEPNSFVRLPKWKLCWCGDGVAGGWVRDRLSPPPVHSW